MTLRQRSLAALGVMLGCAALLVGLLGAEGVLQGLHRRTSQDVTGLVMRVCAEFAGSLLLLVLAFVCLYVATRSPRAQAPSAVAARQHHAVTL